jgi:hypothetical protein
MRYIDKNLYSSPDFIRRANETRRSNEERLAALKTAYETLLSERRLTTPGPIAEREYALTGEDINRAHMKGLCDSLHTLSEKFGTIENACLLAGIPYARRTKSGFKIKKPEDNAG